jgi:hypothetical protein
VLPRGWYDHFWHPFEFAVSQFFFLIPSLLIAAPLFVPGRGVDEPPTQPKADAFDRRIIAWLAFGPMATVLAMGLVSGRGAVAMWGYPLWLFFGVWLVLTARRTIDAAKLARIVITWGVVFVCLALAFYVNYDVLPRFDHRYRAVFFPGAGLAHDISQRFTATTGRPLRYVIGTMWDGGNVEHYAASHPRNLVDGEPQRAPWVDLADLHNKGAAVVWTAGDPGTLPNKFRAIAGNAVVQPSFTLPYRRGPGHVTVGWAIVKPKS